MWTEQNTYWYSKALKSAGCDNPLIKETNLQINKQIS